MNTLAVLALGIAVAIAVAGGTIGIFMSKLAPRRLETLVHVATGALLGVTVFDILPEAKHGLVWPSFLMWTTFGYMVLWTVGKRIFHVCPSCAIAHLDRSRALAGKHSALLLGIALGIHCALDGLAIVAGGELPPRVGVGLLLGVGLHKLPEGLALALLLLGAGMTRRATLLRVVGIQSLTSVGGFAGMLFIHNASSSLISTVFAVIGGGFLYLVFNAICGAFGHKVELTTRYSVLIEGASFMVTGAFIWGIARGFG